MKCANPNCQHDLVYLRGGTLRLLELEGPPEARLLGEPAGFPIFQPRARYFWLCPECSKTLILKRWSPEGLVLESRAGAPLLPLPPVGDSPAAATHLISRAGSAVRPAR